MRELNLFLKQCKYFNVSQSNVFLNFRVCAGAVSTAVCGKLMIFVSRLLWLFI